MAKATRVFVTHQVQYLPRCDRVVAVDNGRIIFNGTFDELTRSGLDVAELVAELADRPANDQDTFGNETDFPGPPRDVISGPLAQPSARVPATKTMADEERPVGAVHMELFVWYLKFCGRVLFFYLIFLVGQQMLRVQGDIFTSYMADRKFYPDPGIFFYIGLQFATGFIGGLWGLLDGYAKVEAGMEAAWRLHNLMLANVLRAPMSFFDSVPQGRIMNRFSSDLDQLDAGVADQLSGVVSVLFMAVSTVGVLISMMPSLLVGFIPLTSVYFYMMQRYRATSRELNRIAAVSSSPMYSHVAESLNGVVTIRAFGVTERFVAQHDNTINDYHSVHWATLNISRWLNVRLDLLGATVSLITSTLVVLNTSLPPGVAGMLMQYSESVTGLLETSVTLLANLENEMNSVDRVRSYTQDLQLEAPEYDKTRRPNFNWLKSGDASIQIQNMSVRYRPGLPEVLKNVSVNIDARQKIGIVGRTGSGKSTLLMTLLRMVEPSAGTLVMGGTDVRTVGLADLRSRISIIPQEPVLFSGTVRSNLDPSSQHSDQAIYNALNAAHCRQLVEATEDKLYTEVVEGGKNFSVGQRQLLCLARALLRGNQILLMDEATANVDMDTDRLIQETVQDAFADCTVITIAHRLETIMKYDKILVMADGTVGEYDTPAKLLQETNGIFYGMVEQCGDRAEALHRMASERFQ
eukprot:NODE_218_length_2460_cov_12.452509_g169_i0.p1 GENE.NODE_218_length_2460_cov_12.452509_g169_i0~~NODE_218_length_2460_cov_12.452509_g169_i0.p1  ORF type:complete len:769 (+),score=229.86 NODE_218_length_2460_cov_12.452509_g169_i0:233-2308(+)